MKELHNNKKTVNQDVVELGRNIQKQREFIGMTQEELALNLNTSRTSICAYEVGQRAMGVDRFFDIARELMVTPAELCPKDMVLNERVDPRLFQIGEKLKKMDAQKRETAYRAMEAMVIGFLAAE